jgi:hypothetical protein
MIRKLLHLNLFLRREPLDLEKIPFKTFQKLKRDFEILLTQTQQTKLWSIFRKNYFFMVLGIFIVTCQVPVSLILNAHLI